MWSFPYDSTSTWVNASIFMNGDVSCKWVPVLLFLRDMYVVLSLCIHPLFCEGMYIHEGDVSGWMVPAHCCFLQISLWHFRHVTSTSFVNDFIITKDLVLCKSAPVHCCFLQKCT